MFSMQSTQFRNIYWEWMKINSNPRACSKMG